MCFRIIFACFCAVTAVAANAIPFNASLQSDALDLANANACGVNIARDLGLPQPLYLRPADGQFIWPQTLAGIIQLGRNAAINVHCPNGFQGRFQSHQQRTISAACVSGNQFTAVNQQVRFNEFRCVRPPPHQPRPTNQRCPGGGHLFEIGFTAESRYLRLYTVCHNVDDGVTRWVHYNQNPENQGFQRAFGNIDFIQGPLFYSGLSVNNLYTRNQQRRTIATILGSDRLAGELIQPSGDLFLSRGHLAARSDFIFGNHQLASFYFVNAAPQWQSFNGGNWATLEDHLKRYIARRNINTEIYTGTFGLLTFPDIRGVHQPIHLSVANNRRRIPVPQVFYKVVINARNRAGIAFIGINNPYASLQDIQRNYTLCRNVMERVNYIPWSRNLRLGYLYACSVSEFARAIGHLPQLPPTDNLLL